MYEENCIGMNLKDLKYLLMLPVMVLLVACAGNTSSDSSQGGEGLDSLFFISELMSDNRTGLLSPDGEPADWVEVTLRSKNGFDGEMLRDSNFISTIESYYLVAVKPNGNTSKPSPLRMVTISALEEQLSATEDPSLHFLTFLKLPKKGGEVLLMSPEGRVMSSVTYPALQSDEAFALAPDGSFHATHWQSPGFSNNSEGHEAFARSLDRYRHSPLLIWEVFSRAEKRRECWVELKNVSDSVIDLEGYSLGKKVGTEQVVLPLDARRGRSLHPGKTLLVQMKMGDAESVVLSKDGKFVDGACAKLTYHGTSVGRTLDRTGFYYFAAATPNHENHLTPYRFIAPQPCFTEQHHVVKAVPQSVPTWLDHIRYTTDGSLPSADDAVFPDSLQIAATTILRAYTEGDSVTLRSEVTTRTYFVDMPSQLPVVAVTIDSADLYDYNRGIYAKGPGYSSQWPHLGANFWKPWTRRAHVEFFEPFASDSKPTDSHSTSEPFLSTDCGLKIFGGYSRYEEKKSFTVKFQNWYGNSSFNADFFGTGEPVELHDIVLRSGSQDWNRCMVRDEFFTSLMAPQCPTLLVQSYRPVSLFINGDYFGLYYLREKIDKHFVANRLDVDEDSVTIIASSQYLEEGSKKEFNALMKYLRSHDMTQAEHFDFISQRIDLQGLIDFKLGEIYSGNTDVGNIRMVRSDQTATYGKWYFVFYDLDATWTAGSPKASYYLRCGSDAQQGGINNRIVNSLLPNKQFRQMFMERLSHHLHHTFATRNAQQVFDNLVSTIRPEMQRNCERWPQLSFKHWEKNIETFRARFEDRPKAMLDDLRHLLAITPEEEKQYFDDLGY